MAIQIFQISDFDHRAETRQFTEMCAVLTSLYTSNDCIYIGNFNIEGVELDSLLITPYSIRIIEYKNWGGNILARENGAWTADGKVVEGGGSNKSPYTQMRVNRSRTIMGLKRLLGRDVTHHVKGCVLFGQPATIANELSPTVQLWMDVCDNRTITELLAADFSQPVLFETEELATIAQRLGIEEYQVSQDATKAGLHDFLPSSGSPIFYHRDAVTSYYEQLEERCLSDQPLERRVAALRDLFYRFVDEEVHGCRLTFSGLFSKVDYIVKEHDIPQQDAYRIHETRKSLFAKKESSQEPLTETAFLQDLKDLCCFISWVRKTEIPARLREAFPAEERKVTWGRYEENLLRVIVNDWDEQYIYATEEQSGREMQICYGSDNRYLTRGGKGDWSYLKEILWRDAQLNLVRLRYDEEVCMPELIIFEPDCLVSITSIASCFEDNMRQTPFLGLLSKVTPAESTKHIQLGNLSGQLLDETVHRHTITFDDSYNAFFHNNIVEIMCDTQDQDTEEHLRLNGLAQKKNIEQLIGDDISRVIINYKPENVLLEPSFFSETLGIQGRLDFLYQDGEEVVIVEQKSGKGQFVKYNDPDYDPNKPVPVDKHVVQLLMYRALFTYEFQKYAEQLKHIFLLYSKYSKGLVSVAQRPELMIEAVRMRNLLAWCEILYAKPGGFKVLESINSGMLRDPKKPVRPGDFFEKYKQPGIEATLRPLLQASDLEKSYYFRFQQFLAKEQMLSRMGNRTKETSGFSSVWLDTLETKKAAGSIYDGLTITSFGEEEGAVSSVTLAFPEQLDCDMTKFRKGDLAFLYKYKVGEEPNACAQMVHRGSLTDITESGITLRLNNVQTDRRVFEVDESYRWAVEPDMIESSSGALYRNMHGFLSAAKERRDLILLQREPEVDTTLQLKGDYGTLNPLVLRQKQARDFFLVIGPPGTGKTSHAMLDIVQEELLDKEGRVLLLSYTNRAVDEMCATLEKAGIDYVRIGNDLSCGKDFVPNLIQRRFADCNTREEAVERFVHTRVVCGTTASVNSHIALLGLQPFSLAVIDESSQILEPHIVGLLGASANDANRGKRVNAIGRFVLIGDHKQLPAVVQQEATESEVTEAELKAIGLHDCRLTFFERLLKHFVDEVGNYRPENVYMLTRQGRMHPDIAKFPNYAFYGNKLENLGADLVPHQGIVLDREAATGNGIRDLLLTRHIAFVTTPFVHDSLSDKVNQPEADMIAATIMQIYLLEKSSFDPDKTLGVIVPYRNQISTIDNTVARLAKTMGLDEKECRKLHAISIDTVERYQGSQRRYILYGFTIQRNYQLNFLASTSFVEGGTLIDRKLNVAMTRAQEHLIIFGNPYLLNENPIYYKMIEFIRSKNGYIDVSPNDFCRGSFVIGSRSEGMDEALSKGGQSDAIGTATNVSPGFEEAFDQYVRQPILTDSRTHGTEQILGNTADINLTQIAYGRIEFSNQMSLFSGSEGCNIPLSPQDQVLLYAYYLLPRYYAQAKTLYVAWSEWLKRQCADCGNRIYMYDMGCGPATCGLAMTEALPSLVPQMTYCGIDTSVAMQQLGYSLLNRLSDGRIDIDFAPSLHHYDEAYWARLSELPSLVIFQFSYFFASVDDQMTEQLALQICHVMQQHPLNHYVFFFHQSPQDQRLQSYRAFVRLMKEQVNMLSHEVWVGR